MRDPLPRPQAPPSSLLAAEPRALLRAPDEVTSEVLRLILARAAAGSRPGARDDDHIACLAIEGGGMRGAVTAGMCVVLEASGLVDSFDRIYGVSAGALNAFATAAGQAALSSTHYQDAAARGVINRMRPLMRRPVIDFDLLFGDVIAARKPLSFEALGAGPEFRALAVSLETMRLRVLADFRDIDEAMHAVRASAALPRLAGQPPLFRGERMTDGGIVEPIPYETALAEGATHVLVLRSRPAGYQKPSLTVLGESFAFRDDPGLLGLLKDRHRVYNRQAAELERGIAGSAPDTHLLQVTVPDNTRLVARLEANGERLIEALRAGAKAMAAAVLTEPIDLCWQPTIYRASPVDAASARPERVPLRRRLGRRRWPEPPDGGLLQVIAMRAAPRSRAR